MRNRPIAHLSLREIIDALAGNRGPRLAATLRNQAIANAKRYDAENPPTRRPTARDLAITEYRAQLKRDAGES